MKILFQPEGLYIFAGIFIVYSVVIWFLPPLTRTKKRRIRTCFFALWTLVFAAYYNICQVSKLQYTANNYGIPQNQWIFILNILGFSSIGVILDSLIISSRGIKSVGKDGINLTDEEDEVIIKNQNNIIEMYEKIMDAEYETIRKIPNYCEGIKKEITDKILYDPDTESLVDTKHELIKITEEYLKNKNSKIEAGILEYKDIYKIKNDFNLNYIQYMLLKSKLKEKSGYLNNFNKCKILIFPYYSLAAGYNIKNSKEQLPLIIILSSQTEDLLIKEQYAIINILRVFETNLQKAVNTIINELALEKFDDNTNGET